MPLLNPLRSLTALLCFSGFVSLSSAQTFLDPSRAADNTGLPTTIDRFQVDPLKASQGSLEDESAFAPQSPGDSDIGQQLILKRNERPTPFRIWANSSVFWTNNVANVRAGEQDDWFFAASLGAAWQQRIKGRLYVDVYASQSWYLYDEFDVLDYELGETGAGLLVLMPELANSIFHVHYVYQRITQGIDDDALYQAHNLRLGLQKTFLINRLNTSHVGIQSILGVDAEPDALQRHEYILNAGHSFKIMRELVLNLSYRLAYYDYFNLQDRHDWYQNFGVNLTWTPKPFLELGLSYTFALNRSNWEVFDYDTQLAGPSLALKFKF